MGMTPERIRQERAEQHEADRAALDTRLKGRRQWFETDMAALYGTARTRIAAELSAMEGKRDLKGLFAAIVRFKDRLTGEIARQERRIKELKLTLANLDMRMAERRATFERENMLEMTKLAHRQNAERERDEKLIAHARGRAERERMGLKAHMNFQIRADAEQRHVPKDSDRQMHKRDLPAAAKDKGPGLLDRMVRSLRWTR